MMRIGVALIVCCLQWCSFQATSKADDSVAGDGVSLDTILTAWSERQERTRSLYFEIVADTNLMNKDFPSKHHEYRLYADGVQYRLETRNSELDVINDGLKLEHHAEIFDGDREISVDVYEHDVYKDPEYFSANIPSYTSEAHEDAIWPIYVTFRIVQPGFLPAGEDCWSLTGRTEVVDGHRCVMLKCQVPRSSSSGWEYDVWVDPAREFVPVRRVTMWNGIVSSRLDIDYEHDSDGGWIPVRWMSTRFDVSGGGIPTLDSTSNWEVSDFRVNQPIDDALFSPVDRILSYSSFVNFELTDQDRPEPWRIAAAVMLATLALWFLRIRLRAGTS